jgi:hypothetical protein
MEKFIHNVSTGETSVEALTEDEVEQIQTVEAIRLESETAEQAKIQAKQSALAKLAGLGLTEDEAKAILGL